MPREVTFDLSDLPPLPAPASRPRRLSPQQEGVLDWVRNDSGNAIVTAVAGSGKTTTLIEAVGAMYGRVAFGAYNKSIADEIEGRVSLLGNLRAQANVGTFHRFGYRALRQLPGQPKLDGYKTRNQARSRGLGSEPQMLDFVSELVSIAKLNGLGLFEDTVWSIDDNEPWQGLVDHYGIDNSLMGRPGAYLKEEEVATETLRGIGIAREMLEESIAIADEVIDFDDQLYLPLYHDLPFPQHNWVLIDEAQDTNLLRLEIARRMLRRDGRLIAVGDPAQAIYGFTGAFSNSLRQIARRFNTVDLPLTVSFRCPKAVVRVAQQWAPHIEAAPEAPEGEYRVIDNRDFLSSLIDMPEARRREAAVLCRYNAPVVTLAFRLLREGVSAHVAGRDIGGQVKNLLKKFGQSGPASALLPKLEEFQRREEARFLARGQEMRAASVVDRCQTLIAITRGTMDVQPGATVHDVELWINRIIDDDQPGLTLSSIHKAKGREWETVYWLGRNGYQPCRWASKDWQLEQESNLMYVAATRAKQALIEVNVKDSKHREYSPDA